MQNIKSKVIVSALGILLVLSFFVSLGWGSYQISASEVIRTLLGNGTKLQNIAVLSIRLPRLLVSIFVAMALSTAGILLQTITKNDLADTGITGINAGAAAAAVLFINCHTADYYNELNDLSIFVLPFMAMVGAGVTAFVTYRLSGGKEMQPKKLLLIGIGINAALNAFITFFSFKGGAGDYNRVLVWTSGSLWGSSWSYVKVIMPIVIVVFSLVCFNYKKLDVFNLSNEIIVSLGLNLQKERRKFLIFAVILAGVATAFAGNIAFLGLISPHIAKKLVGPYHKNLLIVSTVISAIIILLADAVSRNLFSPIEIPVGITVALIGVPYFIYLIIKEG